MFVVGKGGSCGERENSGRTLLHFRETATLLLNVARRVVRSTPLVLTWKQMVTVVNWPYLFDCRTVDTFRSQILGTNFDFPKSSDSRPVAYPAIFFGGGGGLNQDFFRGVQKIKLRPEGRENGDLGATAH
jgi:hypothetical protein